MNIFLSFLVFLGVIQALRCMYKVYLYIVGYCGKVVDVKKTFGSDWVLITGASAGIGQSLAISMVKQGVNVFGVGRNAERLAKTKKNVEELGASFVPIECDLSDENAYRTIMDSIKDKDVGLVILNAGYCHWEMLHKVKDDDVVKFLSCMCTVNTLIAKAFMEKSATRNAHTGIYFVSSLASRVICPNFDLYGPAKTYISRLAKHLSFEVDPKKLNICVMHPGFVSKSLFWNNLPSYMQFFGRSFIFEETPSLAHNMMTTLDRNGAVESSANSMFLQTLRFVGTPLIESVAMVALRNLIPEYKQL